MAQKLKKAESFDGRGELRHITGDATEELKAVPFDPSFVGQLNVYLSAVDDLLKHPQDKPTIGLLLCQSKDKVVVEYALRDFRKPIGVAHWQTKKKEDLPVELKGSLPTVREIEAELGSVTKSSVSAKN